MGNKVIRVILEYRPMTGTLTRKKEIVLSLPPFELKNFIDNI